MARSHVCLACGTETASVRAAMDQSLGLLIARCPGCDGALVRRRDPLHRAVRHSLLIGRSLGALIFGGAWIVGAIIWTAALSITFSFVLFLDRFGDWRPGVTVMNIWAEPGHRAALVSLVGAGLASGCVVRVVWGHRHPAFVIPFFFTLVALAMTVDELADAFESYYRWTIGGAWNFHGGSRTEWLGRGAALLTTLPGFVVGWIIGGAMRSALDWDYRRRWRRKLQRARKRSTT